MTAEVLVLIALPLLLGAAGAWDLASFTIPNFLNSALLALFVLFAAATGLGLPAIGWHLLAGLVGLALGFALFAFGFVGGGDAKLFAVTALWLGFRDLLPYILVASIAGGVLTLVMLALRQCPLPQFFQHQAWITKLHDARSGIPYGVALAAGAFILLPSTEIFRLAAAA
jgi:prepilin peptidase CpaA